MTYLSGIEEVKDFFKHVTDLFKISLSCTRISAATVASTVNLLFDFTTYASNSSVNNAIDEIRSSYGISNSKEGLDFVKYTMFTTENGARPNIRDILIALFSHANSDGVDVSAQALQDNGVY